MNRRDPIIAPQTIAPTDNTLKVSAHCAASVAAGILGANLVATSSLGGGRMGNYDYNSTRAKTTMRIFGTEANSNPDGYLANFTYNLMTSEEIPYMNVHGANPSANKEYTEENWSARPYMIANDLLYDAGVYVPYFGDAEVVTINLDRGERHTICSFYHEPDVLIGCGEHNYTSLLQGFRQYNPDYHPYFADYALLQAEDLIESLFLQADILMGIATVMEAAMEATGKTTRYGQPTQIALDYERYMKGVYYYIMKQIDTGNIQKKTVAISPVYNVATARWELIHYTNRLTQYCTHTMDDLYFEHGGNATQPVTITTEELLQSDVIVTTDDAITDILEEQGLSYNGILINGTPECAFGITQNSHDNAMGIPLLAGSVYYTQDHRLNPIHLLAYFTERFYHVSRDFLQSELDAMLAPVRYLPVDTDLQLDSGEHPYNPETVEALICEGMDYLDTL